MVFDNVITAKGAGAALELGSAIVDYFSGDNGKGDERRRTMTIELTILVSVVSVSAALFFGIKSAKKADMNDVEERAKKNAEITVRLEQLITMTSGMQEDMKALASKFNGFEKTTERLSYRVEELDRRISVMEKGGQQ